MFDEKEYFEELAKAVKLNKQMFNVDGKEIDDIEFACHVFAQAIYMIEQLKEENEDLRRQKVENYGDTHALLESLKGGGIGVKVDSRESDHWKRYWKMYYEETVNDLMARKEVFERAYNNLYEKCKRIGVVENV